MLQALTARFAHAELGRRGDHGGHGTRLAEGIQPRGPDSSLPRGSAARLLGLDLAFLAIEGE